LLDDRGQQALFEADARTQAERQVEVVEAVGYAQHFESALGRGWVGGDRPR
jgi:hypothetical protein